MVEPLDLNRLRVHPLSARRSLTRVEEILIDPDSPPDACSPPIEQRVAQAAQDIRRARERGASVMLLYGAHLLRNGAALLLERMMAEGWLTHLATNGAGTIHDWEYAWFGESTESVQMNVADGTFGAWHETAWNLHVAIMAGGVRGAGYGSSLGRFICEDGVEIPTREQLEEVIRAEPSHELTPARAVLLGAIERHDVPTGRLQVEHRWKQASIVAQAFRHGVPLTVHPGIGYDIISNHPIFSGAAIGRAAELDFKLFGGSVEGLDGGVVLSIGSAIMAPQVFEKSLSCVNNLRRQGGRPTVHDHTIHVVDLQDGGGWDWTTGEPPKTNPAYYLRFCKSFSRMGAAMHYTQCDNRSFVHHLYHALRRG
ncbi:MAG: hypothetical protein RIC55_13720 [Pirellulaceae bacterium]